MFRGGGGEKYNFFRAWIIHYSEFKYSISHTINLEQIFRAYHTEQTLMYCIYGFMLNMQTTADNSVLQTLFTLWNENLHWNFLFTSFFEWLCSDVAIPGLWVSPSLSHLCLALLCQQQGALSELFLRSSPPLSCSKIYLYMWDNSEFTYRTHKHVRVLKWWEIKYISSWSKRYCTPPTKKSFYFLWLRLSIHD